MHAAIGASSACAVGVRELPVDTSDKWRPARVSTCCHSSKPLWGLMATLMKERAKVVGMTIAGRLGFGVLVFIV